jgi:hypothetical protein
MIAAWLQGRPSADAQEVARALERVMGRAGFVPPEKSWLARTLERLGHWLGELFDFDAAPVSGAFATLLYVLLGLSIAWLVWLVVRSIAGAWRARAEARAALPPPPESLAERLARLLAEARAADAAGDHLRALRLYFWALVVGLSQRGELAYRDAWTAREMLERGRAGAEVRARLAPLVREIDKKSFGGEPCDAADSARVAQVCRELLGAGR